jgi:hypothetical protein
MEPQTPLLDVGTQIKGTLDEYATRLKDEYGAGLAAIKPKKGTKIKIGKMQKVMDKLETPRSLIADTVEASQKPHLIELPKNLAHDVFVNRKKELSYYEARKLNSLLSSITFSGKSEKVGTGAIGQLAKAKGELLASIDEAVPQTKALNRKYAKGSNYYKEMNNIYGKDTGAESALRGMGNQIGGRAKGYEKRLRNLKKLDKLQGTNYNEQVLKSTVSEEFDKIGMGDLMDNLRLAGAFGLGHAYGGQVGGMVALGAAQAISTPQATRGIIKAGTKISEIGNKPAIKELRQGYQRAVPVIGTRGEE